MNQQQDRVEQFWQEFLRETGRSPDTRYYDCSYFEMTEYWANELLRLVLEGKKRATCSSLLAYEAEGIALPKAGNLSIFTDWDGKPRCVAETTAVTILPFREMTFEICSREGEDECLATWVEGHERYFRAEGEECGYAFTPDMPVVFEDFRVIYQK